MSSTATSAPRCARRTAHARPIPRAAPVTTATLPARDSVMSGPSWPSGRAASSVVARGVGGSPNAFMRAPWRGAAPSSYSRPMVDYEARDRVALITINRPEARNAINGAVAAGLEAAVERLEADPEAWIGVIAGDGPVFSAGADLKEVAAGRAASLATERGGFAGITRLRAHQAADRRRRRPGAGRRLRDRADVRPRRRLDGRDVRHPRGQALADRGCGRLVPAGARTAAQRRHGARDHGRPDHRRARLRPRPRQRALRTGRRGRHRARAGRRA